MDSDIIVMVSVEGSQKRVKEWYEAYVVFVVRYRISDKLSVA